MPERDGGDLLRQIEREFPHIIRILVTAYADRKVLLETVNSGEVFRILEKPLDVSEVLNVLRQAHELSRERTARQQRLMAINETLGFLAHELNTPLAAIVNFSRGVQRRVADVEVENAIVAINDNAKYCLSLLSSFVDSVKGVNTPATRSSEMTAYQMVLSLLDTYPLTSEQRACIQVDVQEDFQITALPNCVALVLSSILSNALRALYRHESPMIHFTLLVEERPQIRISNNGPVISSEVLGNLMVSPFTTYAATGGKGWGMIFCKRIMQSFGGSILATSSAESNTVFTLQFPSTRVTQ
jgi:two-component system response regulator PhcR